MPAYGKNLSPAEIEALVSFLETLHPANEPPAYDASRRAVEASQAADARRNIAGQAQATAVHDRHHDSRGSLHAVGHSLDRDLRACAHCARSTCGVGRASAARVPRSFRRGGLATFLGGIVALFVAVASPLDTFSESLLFMHMAQHYVLMSIAPPLIVLGAPVVPMLRGLPRLDHSPAAAALRHARASPRWSDFSRARAWPGSP